MSTVNFEMHQKYNRNRWGWADTWEQVGQAGGWLLGSSCVFAGHFHNEILKNII